MIPVDTSAGAGPSIPERTAAERVPVPQTERPNYVAPVEDNDDGGDPTSRFNSRRPYSDISLRWFVVLVPLAMAAVAGVLGHEFQQQASSFAHNGTLLEIDKHHLKIDQTVGYMGTIGFVGVTVMAMWSWLTVTNVNRVGHSLRSPVFAAVGWLLSPLLGVGAHLFLDRELDSGYLIGFAVALASLYFPFGTLGGASTDLGGTPQLARTWYLASVIGAFLFLIATSGATSNLPELDPERTFTLRSVACYLGALMLSASAALAYATARQLRILSHHRWARDTDEAVGERSDGHVKVVRRGQRSQGRIIPTFFLRVVFVSGTLITALTSVIALYALRGRAMQLDPLLDGVRRAELLDDHRRIIAQLATVQVGLFAAYALWALVAAVNARRRSYLSPTPFAVAASFLSGPLVLAAAAFADGPLRTAIVLIGVVASGVGFLVGQLVLGRTVSVLGGRGGVFLGWIVTSAAIALLLGFVQRRDETRWQIVGAGLLETVLAIVSCALAWTAMTRLDRACRNTDDIVTPVQRTSSKRRQAPSVPMPAGDSPALTSSQS